MPEVFSKLFGSLKMVGVHAAIHRRLYIFGVVIDKEGSRGLDVEALEEQMVNLWVGFVQPLRPRHKDSGKKA
jgi:hypothetical protein